MIASWMESVSLFGADSRFQSTARLLLLFGAYGLILVRPTLTSGSEPTSLKIGPTSVRFPDILGQLLHANQLRSTHSLYSNYATMAFGITQKCHNTTPRITPTHQLTPTPNVR